MVENAGFTVHVKSHFGVRFDVRSSLSNPKVIEQADQ